MPIIPTFNNYKKLAIEKIFYNWLAEKSNLKKIYNDLNLFFNSIYKIRNYNLEGTPNQIDILTFSILPTLTQIWGGITSVLDFEKKIIIGDCSMGLNKSSIDELAETIPIVNLEHGYKIDYFIRNICASDYVVIVDDDVFFLNEKPIHWAKEQFRQNNNLAVVSLAPRSNKTEWLSKVSSIMGSYCLVIKRSIFIKHNISFQVVKPKGWKKIGNHFDTGDYAHKKLIKLGYKVEIAPNDIKENIIFFNSLSLWGLRILKSKGNIDKVIRKNRDDEYEKVLKTAISLKELSKLHPTQKPVIYLPYLDKAIELSTIHIYKKERFSIKKEIKTKINKMWKHQSQLGKV